MVDFKKCNENSENILSSDDGSAEVELDLEQMFNQILENPENLNPYGQYEAGHIGACSAVLESTKQVFNCLFDCFRAKQNGAFDAEQTAGINELMMTQSSSMPTTKKNK